MRSRVEATDSPNLRELATRYAGVGRVEAIVLRPERRGPAVRCTEARAEPLRGLLGDHRARSARPGEAARKRELTLVQYEHLETVARWCGVAWLDPARLRRNVVVSGVNLVAMRSPFADLVIEWAIGEDVRIEVTGPCDPCSRMEQELGFGAWNALRGHGGVTARILVGGTLRAGDDVRFVAVRRRGDERE